MLVGLAGALSLAATDVSAREGGVVAAGTDERARELYLDGESHYAAGRYVDAVDAFERAYRLSKRPALLFNLGRVHERLGHRDIAADYLRRYLEQPEVEDNAAIWQRISRLEVAREPERRTVVRPAVAAERPDRVAVEPPATTNLPAYIALGVGAAALASTITFGVLSRGAASAAEELCSDDGYCPGAADSDLARAKTFAIAADISLATCIAATGVSAYLLLKTALLGKEKSARAKHGVRLLASPAPGGAEVGLVATF